MAIQIFLNGKAITTEKTSVFSLQRAEGINDPVIILNGFQIQEDRDLQDGDQVFFIQKGVLPPREQLEAMLSARHTPGIQQKIRMGRVAVAGLGGLGSHIAVSLARLGVGYLRLIDDDVVEPSNLNRQHYMIQHLGQYKTEALRAQLLEINPFITVDIHTVRVTEENAEGLFDGCTILCEAFDSPEDVYKRQEECRFDPLFLPVFNQ